LIIAGTLYGFISRGREVEADKAGKATSAGREGEVALARTTQKAKYLLRTYGIAIFPA
jgi:Zn-dependent protease with chaperone function